MTGFGKKMDKHGKEVYIKGGVRGWRIKEKDDDDGGYEIPVATAL